MDFEIGNILYVVITLVAIIIGLLGKKKKPAGTGSGAAEESGSSGILESLGKVFNMGEEEFIYEADPYYEKLPVEEIIEPDDKPISELSITKREQMKESMAVEDNGEEGEGIDYFELVKDFDLVTAVIYSTIIHRKEY